MTEGNLQLSETDLEKYELCKQAIKDGAAVCYIVGWAAREIKEKKYYLSDGYETWEDFIDQEYGWTHRYINQLIADAEVINSLPVSMRKLVTSHNAARELGKIPLMLRPVVVVEASKGEKKAVSGKDIKKAAPPPRKEPSKSSPPPRKASPKKADVKPVFCDETGLQVPDGILPLWKRNDEVRDILYHVDAVRAWLTKVQREADVMYVELDLDDDLNKLKQVSDDMKLARPYAVCPECQGKDPKDCRLCRGRGFISQHRWDTCVAQEIKDLRPKKT